MCRTDRLIIVKIGKKPQKSTSTIRKCVMEEWLAVSFTRLRMNGHSSVFVLISLQEIVNCIQNNGQNCDTKNDAKFLISKWIGGWIFWVSFHRQVFKKVLTFFKFVSLFSNFNWFQTNFQFSTFTECTCTSDKVCLLSNTEICDSWLRKLVSLYTIQF